MVNIYGIKLSDMKLKAIIVDDEKNAIKMLRMILDKYCPDIEILDSFSNPRKAVETISKTQFDILFLDIQMPRMTGFQLLKSLDDIDFDVVFTTAYDQYAIEAFKVNAANYLLKPIDEEDLKLSVKRIRDKRNTEESKIIRMLSNIHSSNELSQFRISVPFNKGIEFIKVRDIVYCKSDNNYTNIYLTDGTSRLVSKTLKSIEIKLPEQLFYRPHNSYVINLEHVEKYYRSDGGYLSMINGKRISIARSKKDEILKFL